MTLKASEVPFTGKKGFRQPTIEAGGYPGRLVQVIDLGLQPQSYEGEEKPPKYMIMTTYELLDEFCVNEEGEVQEDKPRWQSEDFPLNPLSSDRAKSTIRYKAIDPELRNDGDWEAVLGTPVIVNIVVTPGKGKNAGKEFNNISGITAMRPKEAAKAPELVGEPLAFSLDNPDVEVFKSFPQFIQDRIKSNLEFAGSKLEELLSGGEATTKPEPKAVNEDSPW